MINFDLIQKDPNLPKVIETRFQEVLSKTRKVYLIFNYPKFSSQQLKI